MAATDWTDAHQRTLRGWGQRAVVLRAIHESEARRYATIEGRYAIPMILMSTAASVLSFSFGYLPDAWQEYSPLVNGCISSAVALVGTLRSFSKSEQLLAEHRASAMQYALLARSVDAEMALAPGERRSGGAEMVRGVAEQLDRLFEQAPTLLEERKRAFLHKMRKDAEQRRRDETALHIELPDVLYAVPSDPEPDDDDGAAT